MGEVQSRATNNRLKRDNTGWLLEIPLSPVPQYGENFFFDMSMTINEKDTLTLKMGKKLV